MTTTIKIRRDTSANWTDVNPILASGEPGLETDTLAVKYGDGVTAWVDLPYGTIEAALTVINPAQANITSVGTLSSLSVSGNVKTANLSASGNVAFTGANVSLGSVANLHIGGGTANYVLSTDGAGNLTWKVDATNNLGNIVITGDNIGSSNDVVNIVGNNYAQLESNDSRVTVELDGAYISTLDGQWYFGYDGTTSFPNDTIKTSINSGGQQITTQSTYPDGFGVTNINAQENNVVIVSKTSFPNVTDVNTDYTVLYNGTTYPVTGVVNGTPVADNFYITLGTNGLDIPAEIPLNESVTVAIIQYHNWWFDFEGSTQVPGNIYIGNDKLFNINGSHTNGVSFNSDAFSQLYWVPNIADTANVDPDGGGNIYNWTFVDNDGTWIEGENNLTSTNYRWNFTNDGNLIMPTTTRLNSGGLGVQSSAEFGTDVNFGPQNYIWWDRNKKFPDVHIAEGDLALTAYSNNTSLNSYAILSEVSINNPDKVMFSYTFTSIDVREAGHSAIGVGTADISLINILGNDANGIGMADNGAVYINGNNILNIYSCNNGDIVDVAIDRSSNLMWFRVNDNPWNANALANPATGANGIDISDIVGTLYPAASLAGNASITANPVAEGSVPVGFTFYYPEQSGPGNVIRHSEVYLGTGTAEGRQITDSFGNSLAYYGVENTQLPGFAGMVSSDPDVTSMYQVGTDDGDNIILGATTGAGELTSTDYRVAIGVLNANLTVNGMYADSFGTIMSGGGANNSSTIWAVEEGIGITNTLYPKQSLNIDLGTAEKSFDSLYVNDINAARRLILGVDNQYSYWISLYGNLGNPTEIQHGIRGNGVAYDEGGNLYVMGQYYNDDTGVTDTLALKYDPNGNLVWRKNWTDDSGDPCGTFNQEFFILGSQLFWMASSGWNGTGSATYIGKMGFDGVITTAASKIEGGYSGIDLVVYDDNAYFVGFDIDDATPNRPFVISLDTTTNSLNWGKRYSELEGQFNAVTYYGGTLYAVGTVYEPTAYSILTQIQASDGAVLNTIKVLDDWGSDTSGTAVGVNNGSVYVTSQTNAEGGFVLTSLGTNINTGAIWSKHIYVPNQIIYANDISFDGTDIIITGVSYTYGDQDFYLIKLTQHGELIWQRRLYTSNDEGSGIAGVRMADVYNNRIAVTGYTEQDPNGGQLQNRVSITLQLPTDGTGIGAYNNQFFYEPVFYSVETITTLRTVLSLTPESINPTVTDNNGFIPTTVLLNPEFYPERIEITSNQDNAWFFDSEGGFNVPGGGRIYGSSDGNSGYVEIQSGDNNSRVSVYEEQVEINQNGERWKFVDGNWLGPRIESPGYFNNEIQRWNRLIEAGTTQTVWVSQDVASTGAKIMAHIDRRTDNPSYENFDTMVCDITLAVQRTNNVNTKAMISVHGVTYTSDDPLVTFDADIIPGGTYTNVIPEYTSGNGANVEFTVTTNSDYGDYQITVTQGGDGYAIGDTIIISGSDIGGFSNENDLTFKVSSIDSQSYNAVVTLKDYQGTTYAGRAMITCTAIDPTNDCRIKIHARESGSPFMEDNWC